MNHKQEADKIIQEIIPIIDPELGKVIKKVVYEKARKLAILQVNILIKESFMYGEDMRRWKHYNEILTELERTK